MSLGDLYHKNIFSLKGQLKPDRFGRPDRLPDQQAEEWSVVLKEIRFCWEHGESAQVVTDFFEFFNPADKPPRWPKWLLEP